MDLVALVQSVKHQRLVADYMYTSATALLIYEYLWTLHLEIKFIWFSRWTYTKVLFLVIRYTALVSNILLLHNQVFSDLSAGLCKTTFPLAAWTALVQIFLAEIVISIRTWAVWNRHIIVGVGLGAVLFFGSLVFACVRTSKFLVSIELGPPPYSGYRGCFIVKGASESLWPIYLFMTVTSATILILMGISAFQSYRSGNNNKLSHVVHRDGIMFYLYLLCLTAAVMVVKVTTTRDMKNIIDPILDVLYPVFISRIIFNIREAVNPDMETELHTGYSDTIEFAVPPQFASDRYSLNLSSPLAPSLMRGDEDADQKEDNLRHSQTYGTAPL